MSSFYMICTALASRREQSASHHPGGTKKNGALAGPVRVTAFTDCSRNLEAHRQLDFERARVLVRGGPRRNTNTREDRAGVVGGGVGVHLGVHALARRG